MSFTVAVSPFFTTSSGFSTRVWRISETCRRASVPGMISMKAPKAVTDFTVPV